MRSVKSGRAGTNLRNARAIATLCFSPPDSFKPLSPTTVSYPSGILRIVSVRCAMSNPQPLACHLHSLHVHRPSERSPSHPLCVCACKGYPSYHRECNGVSCKGEEKSRRVPHAARASQYKNVQTEEDVTEGARARHSAPSPGYRNSDCLPHLPVTWSMTGVELLARKTKRVARRLSDKEVLG